MSMKATTIFLVELLEPTRALIREAAQEVFPEAQLIAVRSVQEAAQRTLPDRQQLLILTDRDEAEIGRAALVACGDERPCWATLVLGHSSPDLVESVPLEECTPRWLARFFRSVLLQQELVRENLRLRGDLKTLGRRLGHDLRSPLNCLHLNCELVDTLLREDASMVKTQIDVIRKSIPEIAQLIERFSEIITASAEPLPATDVPMDAVVAVVLRQLQATIDEAGAAVQSPVHWPHVQGVAEWLSVIWWNLIMNALKHRWPGTPIQLGWKQENEAVRFWVANRGTAVPAELEGHLFPKFDRLHTHNRHGLGLSIVQRLVSLQQGRCGYERRGPDTSVFYFTLPGLSSQPAPGK
jgi:signal transduction histidine kinase